MTIIHKPDKRRGAAAAAGDAQSGTAPVANRVDRKVANCLCCGKVYQLQDGSSDVKALIGKHSSNAAGFGCFPDHQIPSRLVVALEGAELRPSAHLGMSGIPQV